MLAPTARSGSRGRRPAGRGRGTRCRRAATGPGGSGRWSRRPGAACCCLCVLAVLEQPHEGVDLLHVVHDLVAAEAHPGRIGGGVRGIDVAEGLAAVERDRGEPVAGVEDDLAVHGHAGLADVGGGVRGRHVAELHVAGEGGRRRRPPSGRGREPPGRPGVPPPPPDRGRGRRSGSRPTSICPWGPSGSAAGGGSASDARSSAPGPGREPRTRIAAWLRPDPRRTPRRTPGRPCCSTLASSPWPASPRPATRRRGQSVGSSMSTGGDASPSPTAAPRGTGGAGRRG
jgi:hypothetical protein